jgi:hypothetical protein
MNDRVLELYQGHQGIKVLNEFHLILLQLDKIELRDRTLHLLSCFLAAVASV